MLLEQGTQGDSVRYVAIGVNTDNAVQAAGEQTRRNPPQLHFPHLLKTNSSG